MVQFGKHTFRWENPTVPVSVQIAHGALPMASNDPHPKSSASTSSSALASSSSASSTGLAIETLKNVSSTALSIDAASVPSQPSEAIQEDHSIINNANLPSMPTEVKTKNAESLSSIPSGSLLTQTEPVSASPTHSSIAENHLPNNGETVTSTSVSEAQTSSEIESHSIVATIVSQESELQSLPVPITNSSEEHHGDSKMDVDVLEAVKVEKEDFASNDDTPLASAINGAPPNGTQVSKYANTANHLSNGSPEASQTSNFTSSQKALKSEAEGALNADLDASMAQSDHFEPLDASLVMNGSMEVVETGHLSESEITLSQRALRRDDGTEQTSLNTSFATNPSIYEEEATNGENRSPDNSVSASQTEDLDVQKSIEVGEEGELAHQNGLADEGKAVQVQKPKKAKRDPLASEWNKKWRAAGARVTCNSGNFAEVVTRMVPSPKTSPPPLPKRTPRKAAATPSTAEGVVFVDANGVSTVIDDEGRANLRSLDVDEHTAAAASFDSIDKYLGFNSTHDATSPSPNSKKRKSTSKEKKSTPKKKSAPLPSHEASATSSHRSFGTENASTTSSSVTYADPLPPTASKVEHQLHIANEILRQHGMLSHQQIKDHAQAYPPFKQTLKEIHGPDWKIKFEEALGKDEIRSSFGHQLNLLWIKDESANDNNAHSNE